MRRLHLKRGILLGAVLKMLAALSCGLCVEGVECVCLGCCVVICLGAFAICAHNLLLPNAMRRIQNITDSLLISASEIELQRNGQWAKQKKYNRKNEKKKKNKITTNKATPVSGCGY